MLWVVPGVWLVKGNTDIVFILIFFFLIWWECKKMVGFAFFSELILKIDIDLV